MPFVTLFIRAAAGKNGVVAHSPHYGAAAAAAPAVIVVVVVTVVVVVMVVVVMISDGTQSPGAKRCLESTNRTHWTDSRWLDSGLRSVAAFDFFTLKVL